MQTKEGITSVRIGPPKRSDRYPGVDIVPTIHPAATLRAPDSFHDLLRDVGKLTDTRIWTNFEPPIFKAFEDLKESVDVLYELLRRPRQILTLDIEVGVDKDSDFTHPDTLLCVGLGYEPNKAIVIGEEPCQNALVLSVLRDVCEKHQIVCHNGKFDIQVLMRLGILRDPYCLYGDTMLASYSLDERPGHHGLKALAAEILGAPDYDKEATKYVGKGDSYAVIPRPILYKYNAWDAALTFNLWDVLTSRMEVQGVRRVHDRLIRYSHELIYVELEGVKFDLEYNQELFDTFESTLEPLKARLVEIVEGAYNPNSWQQTGAFLRGLGYPVPDTQADTLQRLLETRGTKDDKLAAFVTALLDYKKQAKSYSTYVKGLRKRHVKGRIYSTFLLHGSVTGRTASRNPNVQNVTRGVQLRKQFIPDEGNVFVQCDYGQIEGRVIAIESDDAYLLGVFADPNRDLFDEIGTKLYGTLEEAKKKERRVRTKAYFYGTGYGREAFSIAQEYRLPEHVVQRDMNQWFGMIPDVKRWQDETKQRVRQGALQTHFGRKRRFGLLTKETIRDIEKEALAFVPQSTANDINLSALCEIRKSGLHVRIPVHDSIMVECPKEDKHDVAKFMTETMTRVAAEIYSDRIPFPADAEFGHNWGELSEA